MTDYTTYYTSPIGNLLVTGNEQAVTGIQYIEAAPPKVIPTAMPDVIKQCLRQLDEYFNGVRQTFEIPLAQPGTIFQQTVWKALGDIPYGCTWSYGQLARHIRNEKSIRAVGTTNGKNQLSILVPCHRVIGTDGHLTGYAGGLWRKQWLLEHEQRIRYGIQTLF